jgi:hypothetical protein
MGDSFLVLFLQFLCLVLGAFLRPGLTPARRRAQRRSTLAARPPAARNAALTAARTALGLRLAGLVMTLLFLQASG